MRALLLLPLPVLFLACDNGGGKDSDVVVKDDSAASSDADADGFSSDEDCNDSDSTVNPGATEICDGLDNNCDGITDDGGSTWYMDADGDSYGDDANTKQSCDTPEGYVSVGGDCKDDDAAIHPNAEELCDELDNNCDGQVDEGVTVGVWYQDADADGYGSDAQVVTACEAPAGYVAAGGDCKDNDPAYNPGASETDCSDSNDYNCDGSVGYADADGDGYAACQECNDGDAQVNPGIAEICDGVDNDCSGSVDDNAIDQQTWYADADADGYGDGSQGQTGCTVPAGYVSSGEDCNDTDPAYNPGAAEVDCTDPNDYNCDGFVGYTDADGDGYAACEDCDDGNPAVQPGAVEVCDGIDNDCSGDVDSDAVDQSSFYADGDGDGYGDDGMAATACSAPEGYVSPGGDCDDQNTAYNPGASETDCADPNDYNCDGFVGYADADGDGFAACEECDDADAAVFPGAVEVCDGIDNDCSGTIDSDAVDRSTWYLDGDADGFGDVGLTTLSCEQPVSYTTDSSDCDDGNALISPAGTEVC
ncbi:MAG TPA: putative metal-binding motif-containing protein, partial [Myxococcota bacterium]|nr:putative metal-binding motif-containing protein [Myxococcota bacterium]